MLVFDGPCSAAEHHHTGPEPPGELPAIKGLSAPAVHPLSPAHVGAPAILELILVIPGQSLTFTALKGVRLALREGRLC